MCQSVAEVNIYGRGYAPLLAAAFLKIKINTLDVKVYWDSRSIDGLEFTLSTSQIFHRFLGLSDEMFLKSVIAKKSLGAVFRKNEFVGAFSDIGLDHKYMGLSAASWWALDHKFSDQSVRLEQYQVPALLLKSQIEGASVDRLKQNVSGVPSGYVIDKASYTKFMFSQCKRLGVKILDASKAPVVHEFLSQSDAEKTINIMTHSLEAFDEGGDAILGYQVGYGVVTEAPGFGGSGMLLDIGCNNLQKTMSLGGATSIREYTPLSEGKRLSAFRYLDKAWQNRTIRIGLAALESPELIFSESYFVQSHLMRLLDIWPSEGAVVNNSRIFNLELKTTFDRIGEVEMGIFSQAFGDSWYENTSQLNNFCHRAALFDHSGYIPEYDHDVFSKEAWVSLLWALGFSPKNVSAELLGRHSEALESARANLRFSVSD